MLRDKLFALGLVGFLAATTAFADMQFVGRKRAKPQSSLKLERLLNTLVVYGKGQNPTPMYVFRKGKEYVLNFETKILTGVISPNGRYVAMLGREGESDAVSSNDKTDIGILDLEDMSVRELDLSEIKGSMTHPESNLSWSRDSKRISFCFVKDDNPNVNRNSPTAAYTINIDGTDPIQWTSPSKHTTRAAFSEGNDTNIFATGEKGGNPHIYVIKTAREEVVPLERGRRFKTVPDSDSVIYFSHNKSSLSLTLRDIVTDENTCVLGTYGMISRGHVEDYAVSTSGNVAMFLEPIGLSIRLPYTKAEISDKGQRPTIYMNHMGKDMKPLIHEGDQIGNARITEIKGGIRWEGDLLFFIARLNDSANGDVCFVDTSNGTGAHITAYHTVDESPFKNIQYDICK